MATIAVTGASGQLGQELAFIATYFPKHDFVFFDSEELDITKAQMIQEVLDDYDIDFLINGAAYTKVDLAESNEELAFNVNRNGAEFLAKYCQNNDVIMMHISSDYVYHNDVNRPLRETDETNPKGVYATSKLAGESVVASYCHNSLIFRTSWLYSSFGNNFVKNMINLANAHPALNVVYDQIGSPTYARDLADRLLNIIDDISLGVREMKDIRGIYNIANTGVTSWFDFAKVICKYEKINCKVSPILSAQYPTAAPRPNYSVFDQTKLTELLGVTMPYWRDSLMKCLKSLKED